MKCKTSILFLLGIVFLLMGCFLLKGQKEQQLTVEDIFGSKKFQGKTVSNIQWSPDGTSFSYALRNSKSGLLDIYEHDVASGNQSLVLEGTRLAFNDESVRASRYHWSANRKYLLVTGPVERTWRSDRLAPYYIYDSDHKTLTALAEGDATLQNVKLSPDGNYVGFVRDYNIHITHLKTGETRALTTDGDPDILNGTFDYNYPNLGIRDAWKWSPDSQRIVFWHTDQSQVKIFHLIDDMPCYPVLHKLKYSNAGERQSTVKAGVVEVDTGNTIWMDLGTNKETYIARIDWTRHPETLAIQTLTRSHQKHQLLLGDVITGQTRVILTDTDPCWVDLTNDLRFFKEKDWFTWTSERSGFRHTYLYDYEGNVIAQLTDGDWEVSALTGLDEEEEWVYLYGKKDTAIDQHVYRVKFDGTGFEKVSGESGWYQWSIAPGCKHAIETFSDIRTPPKVLLRKTNGELVRVLEENKIDAFADYNMVHPEFLKITTSDGKELNAYMIKPADFDPNKKYPVIVYGYPNAGSQTVVNRWDRTRGLWHRMMTEKGYIVFSLDNRTATGYGKAAKNSTYMYYGKYELKDQIEGAKYLASLPYVDGARLGFWGWSGGGYSTCLMLTKGSDYYKTGVSVAPVIDLHCYQSIGVERWMGMPEENPEGYDYVNLIHFVDSYKGNLLLIHGTGDENVKCAFTLQFANALIAAGKQFDMMLYPNRHHDISGGNTQVHLFTKITDYFMKNL
jgi:dipeptidyl-peptidase-4